MRRITTFLEDEAGVTAIEYGLIAGLISVGLIATLSDLGTRLQNMFQTIMNALQ